MRKIISTFVIFIVLLTIFLGLNIFGILSRKKTHFIPNLSSSFLFIFIIFFIPCKTQVIKWESVNAIYYKNEIVTQSYELFCSTGNDIYKVSLSKASYEKYKDKRNMYIALVSLKIIDNEELESYGFERR